MGLVEIKQSLQSDPGFRKMFPEYQEEIKNFLKDTSCPCNAKLYRKISQHKDRIEKYKSGDFIVPPNSDEFKVINANIENLESKLKSIPIGSKVESLARFGTEVTVIIRIPR